MAHLYDAECNELRRKVEYYWFKTTEPYKYITTRTPDEIKIVMKRSVPIDIYNLCIWRFEIIISEKSDCKLMSLILMPEEEYNDTFVLELKHGNCQYCSTSILGWSASTHCHNIEQPNIYSVEIKYKYNGEIDKRARKNGLYQAKIILYFGKWPVIMKRFCVTNFYPNGTFSKHINYLDMVSSRWKEEHMNLSEDDPREIGMSKIYPYPGRINFILSNCIISENQISNMNYRQYVHEHIHLEEITRSSKLMLYDHDRIRMHIMAPEEVNIQLDISENNSSEFEFLAEILLEKEVENFQANRLFVNECHHALLKRDANSGIYKICIVKKGAKKVYVKLGKECIEKWKLTQGIDMMVDVQFLLSRLPFCELRWAADSLRCINKLFPQTLINVQIPKTIQETQETHATPDEVQTSVLRLMMCPIEPFSTETEQISTMPPAIIWGYYGSGKKYAVAHSIKMLVSEGFTVLLCTNTNMLADIYIRQYFHPFYEKYTDPKLKPIRIYDKTCTPTMVDKTVLEYCLMDNQHRFRDPNKKDFQGCHLIVTTMTNSISLIHMNLKFKRIIICEADTVPEWKVVTPLCLANINTHLIFVGCRHQLALPVSSFRYYYSCQSILHRLTKINMKKYQIKVFQCSMQYVKRMDKKIVDYLNDLNVILFGVNAYKGKCVANRELFKDFEPLMFYVIYGTIEKETKRIEESFGYKNVDEAQELVKRVKELRNMWPTKYWGPYDKYSIGVYTYFAAQIYELRNKLHSEGIEDVTVDDIQNAYGTEYDVVFISTVQSTNRNLGDYSFITNIASMTRVVSRAKYAVAVVGNPITLLKQKDVFAKRAWKKYLETATLHGITLEKLETYF